MPTPRPNGTPSNKPPPLAAYHVRDTIPPAIVKAHRQGVQGAVEASIDIIKAGVANLAAHPDFHKLEAHGARHGIKMLLVIYVEKE